jgi:hypothetical protein
VVAGRLQADDAQCDISRYGSGSTLYGANEVGLALPFSDPLAVEACSGHSYQQEQQADDRGENLRPTFEAEDSHPKEVRVRLELVGGDDVADSSPDPASGCGTGDAEPNGHVDVSRPTHEIAKAVVVGVAGRGH